jgi:hypothetical protein
MWQSTYGSIFMPCSDPLFCSVWAAVSLAWMRASREHLAVM